MCARGEARRPDRQRRNAPAAGVEKDVVRLGSRRSLQTTPVFQYFLSSRESGGMADALDLGSSAARRGGSSPPSRTISFQLGITRVFEKSGRGAPRGVRCSTL